MKKDQQQRKGKLIFHDQTFKSIQFLCRDFQSTPTGCCQDYLRLKLSSSTHLSIQHCAESHYHPQSDKENCNVITEERKVVKLIKTLDSSLIENYEN